MNRTHVCAAVLIVAAVAGGCTPAVTTTEPGGHSPSSAATLPRTTGAATTPPAVTPSPVRLPITHSYVFPVSPASAASYGHVHHDYPATDVFAPCESDVVAVTDGIVEEVSRADTWNRATDDPAVRGGLSVSIVGDDGVRYYDSHLHDILTAVTPGARVRAGELIAHVGATGNAAGLGCHVHFGLSPDCGPGDWDVRRGVVYPWPFLDDWRRGDQASPADAVRAWLATHPDRCDNAS